MSIDASVAYVEINEDGSGTLHLVDRGGDDRHIAGQPRLHFATAPYEVTALNGLHIWGGAFEVRLGDKRIAVREGYTRIVFVQRHEFLDAVRIYHERQRTQPAEQEPTP